MTSEASNPPCWMCEGFGGIVRDNTTDPNGPPTWRAFDLRQDTAFEKWPCPACKFAELVALRAIYK